MADLYNMRLRSTPFLRGVILSILFISVISSINCSTVPEISYYSFPLEVASGRAQGTGKTTLSIDTFVGDTAYNDNRLIYRTSPYRLDYYYYHRWASPPTQLLSDYVRSLLAKTKKFSNVHLGFSPHAHVVLTGRVIALDQIEYDGAWKARVGLDLSLRKNGTSDILWGETLFKEAPMRDHDPESFAIAASNAIEALVEEITPTIYSMARAEESKQDE